MNQKLLFLFFLLLPTQLGTFYFLNFSYVSGVRIDYLAPAIYTTDILALLLILINIKHVSRWFFSKKMAMLYAFLLINCAVATVPQLALYKVLKLTEVLAIFYIVQKHRPPDKNILLPFFIGAVFTSVLALLQLTSTHAVQGVFYFFGERYFNLSTPGIAKVSLQGVEILRPYATFSHPNSMAGFYLALYAFFLVHTFQKFRLLRILLLFACAIPIFLSFSKAAILGFLILNALHLFAMRKAFSCGLCTAAKAVLIGAFALVFGSARGDPQSSQKRIVLMINSIEIFTKKPWFGVGLGNYLLSQSAFPNVYSYYFLQPVHNVVLLLLCEVGVFGLGVFGYILLPWLKMMLKKREFLFVLGVVFGTGMVDHYWLTLQQNLLLVPVLFALLASQNHKSMVE